MKTGVQTFKPSIVKWLLLAFIGLSFVAVGIWLITPPDNGSGVLAGWASILFFGLCALAALLNLLPGASFLTLSPEGFTCCAMWRKRTYLWSDLSVLGVTTVQAGLTRRKLVGFSFQPNSPNRPKSETLRRMNLSLSGYEAALNDDYGVGHEALATLMNQYLEASRT